MATLSNFWFLLLCVQSAWGYEMQTVDAKESIGLALHKAYDRMYASVETFTVSWSLHLPYMGQEIKPIEDPGYVCLHKDVFCEREYRYLKQEILSCYLYLKTLEDNIMDTNLLLNGFIKENRVKRALFDLGGSLLESVFGVASSGTVETLHKSIIENTEIIQLLSGNMDAMNTNFEAKLNVHGQRLGTMWQTLNLTHLEITAVRRNLKSLRQEIRNATDDILGALSNHEKHSAYQQMRLSVEYRTTELIKMSVELVKFHTIILTLKDGKLPHQLVSYNELKRTLHQVASKLANSKSQLRPVINDEDLYKYYTIKAVSAIKIMK